jgi:glycosyltransferase involved in cell wall biosynthesis
MKKVVFILNSIEMPRYYKRITEFINHGIQVEVYAFRRNTQINDKHMIESKNEQVNIIGELDDSGNYLKRFLLSGKKLNKLFQMKKHEDNVFYYFGLDMGIVSCFLNKKTFFYEEGDLSHTYIKNRILRGILEIIDKYIIIKSAQTILTSEGFMKYHFKDKIPENISVISNRLNSSILQLPIYPRQKNEIEMLKIGFVGNIRFDSIISFCKIYATNFPAYQFHFYGNPVVGFNSKVDELKLFFNVFFHGAFKNPNDLPRIYSEIDLVLSTYDIKCINVKYAEPNKIYEAIFFETPIIVSSGTFLADKVEQLGIGYVIDAFNEEEVISLIKKITKESLIKKMNACRNIDKKETINDNISFFKKIYAILN